jgi:hypothetical protein
MLIGQLRRQSELDTDATDMVPWLWQGYVAPGKVTLLTSQWKCGKTTLLAALLARLEHGGRLADLAVAPGRAIVVSEESAADWKRRCADFGIGEHVQFLCRPFKAPPSMKDWLALIDAFQELRSHKSVDLVALDPLSSFLPAHAETVPAVMLEALLPLQRLTTAGLGILLPHHPNKGKTLPGQAARGTSVLPSFVDIVIEMGYCAAPSSSDRRRRLWGFSRLRDTPRHLVIELNAAGTDYVVHAGAEEDSLPDDDDKAVLFVLEDAVEKLTRQNILDRWPPDFRKPDSATLWRWLERAVARGLVRQEGTGRCNDPFRYWLATNEDLMRPPANATREELEAWNQRLLQRLGPPFFFPNTNQPE